MRIVHRVPGPHYLDAMLVLVPHDREPGEPTEQETAELFGSRHEADNWRAKLYAPIELTALSCAVRGGRHPEIGELWLFERIK